MLIILCNKGICGFVIDVWCQTSIFPVPTFLVCALLLSPETSLSNWTPNLSFCSICFCRSPVVSKEFHVTLQSGVSVQVCIICFNNHTFSPGAELCIFNFLHMQWDPSKEAFYTLFVVGLMSDYRDCCQVFHKASPHNGVGWKGLFLIALGMYHE